MKVALCQFIGNAEKEPNVQNVLRYAREAGDAGANLLCFHEICTTSYFCYEENYAHCAEAEPVPGPTTDRVAQVAKEYGMVIVLPMYEKVIKGELYNSAVVIMPNGTIQGVYRKTNIPMAKRPENPFGNEKLYFKPGNLGYPVFNTRFGKVGVLICHDRHYPEGARALALAGADMLVVPTATPDASLSVKVWEKELCAHAIFNEFFVAGGNRVGKEDTYTYYGRSVAFDPVGELIVQAGGGEEILVADCNLEQITQRRRAWQFYRERRPETYGILTQMVP